jgi:WD40 repeat protein
MTRPFVSGALRRVLSWQGRSEDTAIRLDLLLSLTMTDRTVRVWDAQTGDLVGGPFEGRCDWIRSVAFSPDGTRLVSDSDHDD